MIMEMTAAAAILYTADAKWNEYRQTHSTADIISGFCKVGDTAQAVRILEYVERLGNGNLSPIQREA